MENKTSPHLIQPEPSSSRAGLRPVKPQAQSRFKRMLYSISLESEWAKFALLVVILVIVWLLDSKMSASN